MYILQSLLLGIYTFEIEVSVVIINRKTNMSFYPKKIRFNHIYQNIVILRESNVRAFNDS